MDAMSGGNTNPLTTARINKTVYDLRHWKLTLTVMCVFVLFRFFSGRNLKGGGRSTDAKFFRSARRVHGSWWNSTPGVVRLGVRLGVIVLLGLLVTGHYVIVAVAGVAGCAGLVWAGIRQLREERHLDDHVRPVWPAVAAIIGVSPDEHPSAWLDVPADLTAPDAEITVGLRTADNDDDRKVRALTTLFEQRLGAPMASRIDYTRRLVRLFVRPPEPAIWPAVANALKVPTSDLAADWLTVGPGVDDAEDLQAAITVRLPNDLIDDRPVTEALKTLVNARYAGEWLVKTDRQARKVTLRRKPPERIPPRMVDFLTEYPYLTNGAAANTGEN